MNDRTMRINITPVEKFEGWELADELGILQAQIGELKEREGTASRSWTNSIC